MIISIKDFFDHIRIQLPLTREIDDFQMFVKLTIDNYLDCLSRLDPPDSLQDDIRNAIPDIHSFCDAAKEAVNDIHEGQPAEAYRKFSAGIQKIERFLHRQSVQKIDAESLKFLYRVRQSLSYTLDRRDMFHIPFEIRHMVSTQRYSIPGLPCLYLAGSLYTCWSEMGRPPFHELQAAAFWSAPNQNISLIDFAFRPAAVSRFIKASGEVIATDTDSRINIANHVILWPLMALCSIKVKHRSSPFKPEYIIPQLLLQWITKEEKYDGICYFSMHVDPICTANPLAPCNLVFPATRIRAKGRCEKLRKLFRMTDPHGWQLLSAVKVGHDTSAHHRPGYIFEFIPGSQELYLTTDFGVVESRLNKIASRLQSNDDGVDSGLIPE